MIKQIIEIINQDFNFYNNNLSLAIEKKSNELSIFQNKIDFAIQKVINFSIIENNKQQSELGNIINAPQSNLFTVFIGIKSPQIGVNFFQNERPILLHIRHKEIINFDKFVDKAFNSYLPGSKKIQTITDDIKTSLINNRSAKNNYNIFDLKANNEIKVLKNNKIVYINKNILNSYSISRSIKKCKKFNFILRKKRSSKYRGVSKNGNNWQVLMMINYKKYYYGSYPSEELAARVYDIQAIKNWGIKARTNFIYDKNQIQKIYNKKINIKCNDLSDIMTQLNN